MYTYLTSIPVQGVGYAHFFILAGIVSKHAFLSRTKPKTRIQFL